MLAENNKAEKVKIKEEMRKKGNEREQKIRNKGLKHLARKSPLEIHIDKEYEIKIHTITEKEKSKITNEIEEIRAKSKKKRI